MSINLNGSDIDTNDITNVYLDLQRNITVTTKDSVEIFIKRSDGWRELYEKLTGHCEND